MYTEIPMKQPDSQFSLIPRYLLQQLSATALPTLQLLLYWLFVIFAAVQVLAFGFNSPSTSKEQRWTAMDISRQQWAAIGSKNLGELGSVGLTGGM